MTGQEFKSLRARLGLTQAAIAQRLGVSVTAVWRWESGQRRIDDLRADGIRARLRKAKRTSR